MFISATFPCVLNTSKHGDSTMRAAPKVMPPILLCWPTMSETNVGGMAVEVEPSHQYPIMFCCHVTDGSRGTVWQDGSDMEVQMKQRCELAFLHVEKIAPTDICCHLLNVYGDQTVDMSTVKIGLLGQYFLSNVTIIAAVKQGVSSTCADFYKCSMQACSSLVKMHK